MSRPKACVSAAFPPQKPRKFSSMLNNMLHDMLYHVLVMNCYLLNVSIFDGSISVEKFGSNFGLCLLYCQSH